MKRTSCLILILICHPALVFADGGTLRLSQRWGDWQVSVFTSPSVLRAGPVDVSVLVQDAATGRSRSDVPVSVRLQSTEQPLRMLEQPATTSAATNKLFRDALFDLPRPGTWRATIFVGDSLSPPQTQTGPAPGPPPLTFEFDVAPPPPAWLQLAPWVGWPLLVAALFVWHQSLVSRREARRHAAPKTRAMPSVPLAGTTA